MKVAAAVVALFLTAASDELAKTQVGPLTVMTPAAWKRLNMEGTTRFAAPNGEAYFQIDTNAVQREGGMPAEECITKILANLAEEGFERITVSGQPAARKIYSDTDEQGKKYVSHSVVGCDGKTTWSLQFHMVDAKKDRYTALAGKVVSSIRYAKGP